MCKRKGFLQYSELLKKNLSHVRGMEELHLSRRNRSQQYRFFLREKIQHLPPHYFKSDSRFKVVINNFQYEKCIQ
jgi:hypothetical protein